MTMNQPDKVILHCSASPDYEEGHEKYDALGAADIKLWHTRKPPRGNGWDDIGYHFVVRRTGIIEPGRVLDRVGAHVRGQNQGSIGVCYVGTARPTMQQLRSITIVAKLLNNKYGLTHDNWFGHNDFTSSKTCPGFSINLVREIIRLDQGKDQKIA